MTAGSAPGRAEDRASTSHDLTGWFVRRAGLARFTTFACALGLALSAATGAKPTLAAIGLMTGLGGALLGAARSRAVLGAPPHSTRRHPRRLLFKGPGLVILSVLLVGLFAGYLGEARG